MQNNDFVIIVPFRNAERFIVDCVKSIENQKYKNFTVLYIDDCSDDNSFKILQEQKHSDSVMMRTSERKFPLYNTVMALNKTSYYNSETIVCIVDGDDRLENDYVLNIINDFYNNNDCLLTYGNMISTHPDKFFTMCCSYTPEDFKDLRKHSFRCSHLRTFKYKVWQEMLIQDTNMNFAKDLDGTWLSSAGDVALQHGLMEVAGYDKVKFIDTILYRYSFYEGNECTINKDEQLRCMNVANMYKPFKQIF